MTTALEPYHGGSYLMPSLGHATVADAMHPGILSCDPGASYREVATIMVTHHVHCVAVMDIARDGSGDSMVWGIISDLDLLTAADDKGAELTARDLAAQAVISLRPGTSLIQAGELMRANGVSHVVVIDPETQRPIGILSTLDVAGVLAWGEA
ncbi:MAG TPA: CBS domain-containing protein [Solirubrobacteraceae bacterium]